MLKIDTYINTPYVLKIITVELFTFCFYSVCNNTLSSVRGAADLMVAVTATISVMYPHWWWCSWRVWRAAYWCTRIDGGAGDVWKAAYWCTRTDGGVVDVWKAAFRTIGPPAGLHYTGANIYSILHKVQLLLMRGRAGLRSHMHL